MTHTRTLALLLAAGGMLLQAQEVRPTAEPQEPELVARQVEATDDAQGVWPPLGPGGRPITDKAGLRREAHKRWYGERNAEFGRFLMGVAADQRERFADLMPDPFRHKAFAAAPASGTWLNIGPTKADVIKNGSSSLNQTDSGRPRTILVDPNNANIIYVATAGGGVWKTTNGGTSWTPLSDALGSLSCGYLAMDPANSSVLYLGLGDPFDGSGNGIVKSTDGGVTWSAPVLLGASSTIQSVLVHPTNSSIVLVSTNAGLFRSTDGGASYGAVASIAATAKAWDLAWAGGTNFVMTLEADPANASSATAGQVWRSTDSGATWTQASGIATTCTRISVASAPNTRTTLYAMASKADQNLNAIYKSTDGGATWTSLATTGITDILGGQGFYNHAILIDPSNASTVYLGGQLYMAKSTSGGTSWTKKTDWLAQGGLPYVHADFHCGAMASSSVMYAGTDGGIFKSTDGGTTWTSSLNIGITSHLIYSVGSSLNTPNAVIGGFQDNGTRVRSTTTTTYNQYIGGDGFGAVMNAANGNTMLGSLYYTRVYKSTNGGSTFAVASTGITESNNNTTAPFITRIFMSPADSTGNTVYTFANLKVYKSTNFAGAWTAMGVSGLPTTSFVIRNVGAAKSNGSVVGLVANAGRVYLTANAGSSWTLAGTTPNNGSYMSYVAFDPTDYNVVYAASVAPDATKNHVWKSSNFGSTWTAIDGNGLPSGVPVNIITVDPGDRNVLYAGTELGLYRSGDAGATWARWGSGLPFVNVTDIWVAPDSSKVRLATFGRGFWELQGSVVVTAPSITGQPVSTTVTAGQTASFSVTASGTAPLAYQWFKNSAAISGATAASYTTPATVTGDSGSGFYVTVSNSAGGATSSTATLTVNAAATAPSITGQPSSVTVTAGATATFTVTASGTAPLTYQWQKNGANIAGATAASYTTPATTTGDSGATFRCVVTNSAGSATSNNATLTVNAAATAPTITTQPASQTVTAGATATFSVAASGTAPFTYQWRKNAVNISGATASSYTTPATTTGDSGSTFSVVVSNSVGSATSANATLMVNSVPPSTTFNEVEPNDTVAAANAVGATYTAIQGTHTATGNPDFFALTLSAGQKITIAMTGPTGVDWDLALKNSAGTTLTSSTGSTATESVTYTNSGASALTVYANVYVYSGTSATPYNLALSYVTPPPSVTYNEVEANNTIATANTVPDTATKVVGYIGSSTDNDYFKVTVGAGKTLAVAMTGPTGTTYDYDLYFYNAAGTSLASGTGSTTTENVSWTNGATATTVYVAVKRYAGSSTTLPYNLAITR